MRNPAFSEAASPLAAIARDLLTRQPGERLPTVGQYQERLGIGSGTVQSRLRTLTSIGAVTLQARGHQGTSLLELDLSKLWSVARFGSVRGILPLPEAFEPVGLAVLLRRRFQQLEIPLELLYLHGSGQRIDLVREGRAHFAVASKPAAVEATSTSPGRWLTLDFGPDSYHREDSMVVLLRPHLGSDDRISKIGVDPECHDHVALTHAEFPAEEGYTYSVYSHSRLPTAVAEGIIDAAIWPRTTPVIPLAAVGIAVRPLHRHEAIAVNRALSCAVLLADADCPEVVGVLRSIELSAVRSIQEEILRSEALPLY
jgi:hypothetical protein